MKLVESSFCFDNGMVMTFDQNGEQIPGLQGKFTKELRDKIVERSTPRTILHGFPCEYTKIIKLKE